MRAVQLTGIRQVRMNTVADPKLEQDTDVLIRMACVGVCGSDVHYFVDGKIGSQVVKYPFTVGHEGAGIIEKVGSAVTRVKPGDRVAVDPAMSCGQCDQCRAGRPHTCRKLRFLGCPKQAEGCLSEYLVMPQSCCFPIPDSMTLEQAALSEPLAIGVYAVRQSIPMKGATVGILGAGPIGLSVLLPARAWGASRIYMTDLIDQRCASARSMGADWSGNPQKEDVVASITSREPEHLDVVFECCGDQAALDQALDMLKPGGKLMIVGIPRVDRISFSIDKLRHREICIQNVRRQNECVQHTLDLMASGAINADAMVTHRFPFEKTADALELAADYGDGIIKGMIEFGV